MTIDIILVSPISIVDIRTDSAPGCKQYLKENKKSYLSYSVKSYISLYIGCQKQEDNDPICNK